MAKLREGRELSTHDCGYGPDAATKPWALAQCRVCETWWICRSHKWSKVAPDDTQTHYVIARLQQKVARTQAFVRLSNSLNS